MRIIVLPVQFRTVGAALTQGLDAAITVADELPANLGAVVDGARLIATVPSMIAAQIRATRPHLRALPVPFRIAGATTELLWPATVEDDDAGRFARARIAQVAKQLAAKHQRG